ncbi:MAG: hypothetical protein HGA22_00125, partial [Clostridiales bacterium]|nr:hypothetical protein [Clostridiales bacterium]
CELVLCYAALMLPKKMPEALANSSFKMSKNKLYVMVIIAIILDIGTFTVSFSELTPPILIAIAAYIAVMLVYAQLRGKVVLKSKKQLGLDV